MSSSQRSNRTSNASSVRSTPKSRPSPPNPRLSSSTKNIKRRNSEYENYKSPYLMPVDEPDYEKNNTLRIRSN